MHSLWWLQSLEIITCNSVLDPLAHAIISTLELVSRFIFLVQARPFICKQDKCIQFRQHHILMNIRIVTKKRKYLIIQLACASSSNWSSVYSSRGCGCNNGIDVLITGAASTCWPATSSPSAAGCSTSSQSHSRRVPGRVRRLCRLYKPN